MKDKQHIRWTISRLNEAERSLHKVKDADVSEALQKVRETQIALSVALDPLLVRIGESDPLTEKEEHIYDNLQRYLRFDGEILALLTPEQRFSAARVINRQGGPDKIRHPVAGGVREGTLGISFDHIFIGIEPDGYAHS